MQNPSQRCPISDAPQADFSLETRINEGTWIGKFQIVSELGRGGMAVVYKAHDSLLDRPVAIKVLPRTQTHQAAAIQRFLQEARSVARISHPNIVAVYDADQYQGQYYIVLELVHGRNMQDVIRSNSLSWLEATRALADACRGLAIAHEMGVVHRDIKPSNLIQAENGCVKLADFGLVRMQEPTGPRKTVSGSLMGTPEFMSPEQCRSELADVRSDIYSVGATYFALLTGRPPFTGGAPLLVMNAHLWSAIPDPGEINSAIPDACSAIIRRAMAKDPDHRYQCMTELLNDLAAILCSADSVAAGSYVPNGASSTGLESVFEQSQSTLDRADHDIRDFSWGLPERSENANQNSRQCRPEPSHSPRVQGPRHQISKVGNWYRGFLTGLALTAGALVYCLLGSPISPHLPQSTTLSAAISNPADGGPSVVSESTMPSTGIQIPGLKQDPRYRPSDIQSWSMDYPGLQSLCTADSGDFLVALIGESLASTSKQASAETSFDQGRVQVWGRDGTLLLDGVLDGPGTTAVVSHDDRLLAVGTDNGNGVRLWNTTSWKVIADIPSDPGSRIEAITFSEDNHWLAFTSVTNSRTNSRVTWDLQKQELLRAETTTGKDPIRAVVFKPGGDPVVQTCTERGAVGLWAHRKIDHPEPILRTGAAVNAVAFSPGGQLVAAGMGPYFAIWNCSDSRREHAVNNVLADVQCVAFSATGQEVCWAAGSAVQCLNVKTKRPIASFSTRGGHVISLAILPNAAGVWATCDDGKLMFWSLPSLEALVDGTSHH